MKSSWGIILVGLFLIVVVSKTAQGHPQIIYAGFDHVLAFDTSDVTVSAFDYRRHLQFHSTCDAMIYPPLVEGAEMLDWLSKSIKSTESQDDLVYTHMGYEVFLIENKETGAYVLRRCRDFRPQLTLLPCEAYATGQSQYLQRPYRTIFIGNDRVMMLNTETAAFTIHPFDVDVHTGGDPFKFSFGPILSGEFPIKDQLANLNFAYIQLKNYHGDVLVFQHPNGFIQGWRFNGNAKESSQFDLRFVFQRTVPRNQTMTTLGENQLIFYDDHFFFSIWDISKNETDGNVIIEAAHHGNALRGSTCIFDNATACVGTAGCAWCPSTYTCHSYDVIQGHFCDQNVCSVPPLVDKIRAGQAVIVPDCVKNVDPEANHAEIFDTIWEGEDLLPGHIRLPREYRKDVGDFDHSDASPIHPVLDNELGDKPHISDVEHQDDIIQETNRVAQGKVYLPPSPSDSAPCMNSGYDESKASEIAAPATANWKMNIRPQNEPAVEFVNSPAGEVAIAENEHDGCARHVRNVTGTTDVESTHPSTSGVPENAGEEFHPRQGESPSILDYYQPASTSTRHEEDLMNSDKTEFADLNARWVDAAEEKDYTRAPKRSDNIGFKPRETTSAPRSPKLIPQQGVLRIEMKDTVQLMNEGLPTEEHLANSDCTENGGLDGLSTPIMASAMQSSGSHNMPETLEDQLQLFKDEVKNVADDGMFAAVPKEEHLHAPLPEAPAHLQDEVPPVKDYGTEIKGVSPDEEGERRRMTKH